MPHCGGFGRIISIDKNKVIPDTRLAISQNAIRAFSGKVFRHCQEDLIDFAKRENWTLTNRLKTSHQKKLQLLWDGDSEYQEGSSTWYGIENFFKWVEKKTYKMHIRVFLSKYRGYFLCTKCKGNRLKKESTLWKWNNKSLPELYALPVDHLESILPKELKSQNQKVNISLGVYSLSITISATSGSRLSNFRSIDKNIKRWRNPAGKPYQLPWFCSYEGDVCIRRTDYWSAWKRCW